MPHPEYQGNVHDTQCTCEKTRIGVLKRAGQPAVYICMRCGSLRDHDNKPLQER